MNLAGLVHSSPYLRLVRDSVICGLLWKVGIKSQELAGDAKSGRLATTAVRWVDFKSGMGPGWEVPKLRMALPIKLEIAEPQRVALSLSTRPGIEWYLGSILPGLPF
jgi:hypothetical protein